MLGQLITVQTHALQVERDCFTHVLDDLVNRFPRRNDAIETNDVRSEVCPRILNYNREFSLRLRLWIPACFMMLASGPVGTSSEK